MRIAPHPLLRVIALTVSAATLWLTTSASAQPSDAASVATMLQQTVNQARANPSGLSGRIVRTQTSASVRGLRVFVRASGDRPTEDVTAALRITSSTYGGTRDWTVQFLDPQPFYVDNLLGLESRSIQVVFEEAGVAQGEGPNVTGDTSCELHVRFRRSDGQSFNDVARLLARYRIEVTSEPGDVLRILAPPDRIDPNDIPVLRLHPTRDAQVRIRFIDRQSGSVTEQVSGPIPSCVQRARAEAPEARMEEPVAAPSEPYREPRRWQLGWIVGLGGSGPLFVRATRADGTSRATGTGLMGAATIDLVYHSPGPGLAFGLELHTRLEGGMVFLPQSSESFSSYSTADDSMVMPLVHARVEGGFRLSRFLSLAGGIDVSHEARGTYPDSTSYSRSYSGVTYVSGSVGLSIGTWGVAERLAWEIAGRALVTSGGTQGFDARFRIRVLDFLGIDAFAMRPATGIGEVPAPAMVGVGLMGCFPEMRW